MFFCCEQNASSAVKLVTLASQEIERRQKGRVRENLGKKCVCGPQGATHEQVPPTQQKGPMAQQRARGPCDPKPNTRAITTLLRKERTNPLRSRRSPGSHSSQDWARSPVPGTARSRSGFSSETCVAAKPPRPSEIPETSLLALFLFWGVIPGGCFFVVQCLSRYLILTAGKQDLASMSTSIGYPYTDMQLPRKTTLQHGAWPKRL